MTKEKESFGHDTFLSVFTWRYGSPEMRRIFSEVHTRSLWRRIWVDLASAQAGFGLVSKDEVEDLKSKMSEEDIDIERAHQLERQIKHDVMAEIKVFAEQSPKGGGKIHLGATSADVEDNADILKFREALDLTLTRLVNCLKLVSDLVSKFRNMPCIGWTHLQPAEPTTLGYRFANYAQDVVMDIHCVEDLLERKVKGKGFKGAVGTAASYARLLEGKGSPSQLASEVEKTLGLPSFTVSTQTYPRKVDYLILSTLASIAQSAHKFAFDIRLLQSPAYGELSEPVGEKQVGSTAMPFKRNPVKSERICSLARYLSTLPLISFNNTANSLLERTIDDSANRRIVLPEGFLATDEILLLWQRVAAGLTVYPFMIKRNLERYGPFACTEAILMKLTEKGEDRQEMHERIRKHSFKAWEEVAKGNENPLINLLKTDPVVSARLRKQEIELLLDPSVHTGDASERCVKLIEEDVQPLLEKYRKRLSVSVLEGY